MKKMKNETNIYTSDLIFDEEVSEDELIKGTSSGDINFIQKRNKNRMVKRLVVFAVVLLFLSLLFALYGFVRLGNSEVQNGSELEIDVLKYNLFVEHSDSSYGGEITSFSNYSSVDKAFTYDFNISNNNPVKLDYIIDIVNNNYGVDGVDMSLINYSLVKNQAEIERGTLENLASCELYSTDILSNVKDEYVLKLWSDKIDNNLKFSFKINIRV